MGSEYLNNKVFENIIAKFQTTKKQQARYELIIEDLQDMASRKTIRNKCSEKDMLLLNSNKKTYDEIILDHMDSKQELAIAFYTLSENIVNYARFNLIDADDAVQEGVMICFEKINRFDPRKGKAFNYMTTCILNHFRQLYRTARNYNELKRKYLRHLQMQSQILIQNGKESPNWRKNYDF